MEISDHEMQKVMERAEIIQNMDLDQFRSDCMTKLKESVDLLHKKLGEGPEKWYEVKIDDKEKSRVRLFTQPSQDGFYMVKTSGIMKGRADRYLYLCIDNNWLTRQQWESGELTHISQELEMTGTVLIPNEKTHKYKERKEKFRIVQNTVQIGYGIWPRFSLGLQWDTFNPKSQAYKCIFRSQDFPPVKTPDGHVRLDAFTGAWFKQIDEERTHCVIFAHVNPKGWLSPFIVNLFTEKLRDRLFLMEKVATHWDKYYGPKFDPRRRNGKIANSELQEDLREALNVGDEEKAEKIRQEIIKRLDQ